MTAAALAARPRGWTSIAVGAAALAVGIALGAVPGRALAAATRAALPLTAFLVAAFWLAALVERSGLARRLAAWLLALAARSSRRLYALTCLLCAALTATISLDGAVVVLVALVGELAGGDARLRRTLLLGIVAVANASSLAVPQGNPTNLVVMQQLGLGPSAFVAHLLGPALLATLVCAAAPALGARGALRAPAPPAPPLGPASAPERLAAVALLAAAAGGVAGPALGISPWLALAAVAVATRAVAGRIGGCAIPRPVVPWRIAGQVAVLVALVAALPRLRLEAVSPTAAVAVALAAAAAAALVNNLPATVGLAGLLGAPGLTAYAALVGVSVGALTTPHGSVATLVAFERAGTPRGFARALAPAALAACALAALALWIESPA